MNYLFSLLAIIISFETFGQCKFMSNSVDEFTGRTEKFLEMEQVYRDVHISIGRMDSLFVLVVYGDVGCASKDESKIYIKFEDGKVIELKHAAKTECGGMVGVYANITFDLPDLKFKPVSKMRLSGTERNIDFELKDKYFFVPRIRCVE